MAGRLAIMEKRPLNDLLERLKADGWEPCERAIVYREWRAWVRAGVSSPQSNQAPGRKILNAAAAALEALNEPADLEKYRMVLAALLCAPEKIDLKKPLDLVEDPELNEKMVVNVALRGDRHFAALLAGEGVNLAKSLSQYGERYPSELATPETWKQLRAMEMTEDDLAQIMGRDRLRHSLQTTQAPEGLTLEQARGALTKAVLRNQFTHFEFSPLDGEDTARCWDMASCLNRLADKMEEVASGVTLGLGRTSVSIGMDRSGSSGFCQDLNGRVGIGVAPDPGIDLGEVLAHECLHGHDFILGEASSKEQSRRAGRRMLSGQMQDAFKRKSASGDLERVGIVNQRNR
jgi:hypothetical protein